MFSGHTVLRVRDVRGNFVGYGVARYKMQGTRAKGGLGARTVASTAAFQ